MNDVGILMELSASSPEYVFMLTPGTLMRTSAGLRYLVCSNFLAVIAVTVEGVSSDLSFHTRTCDDHLVEVHPFSLCLFRLDRSAKEEQYEGHNRTQS